MKRDKKIESIKKYVSNSETPEDFQRRYLLSKGYLHYQNRVQDLQLEIQRLNDSNDLLLKKINNLKLANKSLKSNVKVLNNSLKFKNKESK